MNFTRLCSLDHGHSAPVLLGCCLPLLFALLLFACSYLHRLLQNPPGGTPVSSVSPPSPASQPAPDSEHRTTLGPVNRLRAEGATPFTYVDVVRALRQGHPPANQLGIGGSLIYERRVVRT